MKTEEEINEDNIIPSSSHPNNNQNNISIYNAQDEDSKYRFKKKKKWIIFGTIGIIVLLVIIIVAVVILSKNKKDSNSSGEAENPEASEDENEDIKEISSPINPIQKNANHIESEFAFQLDVKDLKMISVTQNYTENVMTNGQETNFTLFRKTLYEIFVLSENMPDEENKNFYNKKYTASILINSQCVSIKNENCSPQKMINISKINSENIQNSLESLDELDYKDLPIPLCLFNMTDNDVITSITCPEKLQKSIIQNMILDLYFFRPPAIKRPNKAKRNITINKWKENDKYYIRELNGGICDIPDSFNSFCTTDMNTSTNLNGTLLTYDEVATSNITIDEINSFYKIKTTNLIDKSKQLENSDKPSYEQILNKIISKLNPYMKYKEEFSTEEFKMLYNASKNITTDKKESKRNLNDNSKPKLVAEENLMEIKHYGGVNAFIKLKNDIGLNVESMKAFVKLMVDDSEKEIINLKEYSNIGEVLNQLIILSKSGNELILELYNKLNDCFENINSSISDNVTNIINIIVYNDLSEIFDSTLSLENVNFPVSIIVESSSLRNKLLNVYNDIDSGGMKINALNKNIYDYIQNCHKLVNNIFKNVQNLSQSLNSTKSKLTEISTYFVNNTPSSFIETIKEAEEILMNYYKSEKNYVLEKLQELLNMFEDNIKKAIQKEEKVIDNLYIKLQNEELNIVNGNNEDYRNMNLDLYNSKQYITDIIAKGKEKIENEMDLKDSGYFISNYDLNSNNFSYVQTIEEATQIATKIDNDEFIDKDFCNTMSKFKENYTSISKYMDRIKKEQFPLNDDVLNTSYFTNNVKQSFNLDSLGINISNAIRNENDEYLNDVNEIINDFLQKNKTVLEQLFMNLTLLFSEESLEILADNYEKDFTNSLKIIESDIDTNKKLSSEYFEKLKNLTEDNIYIIDLLKSYKTDEVNLPYINRVWHDRPNHYEYLTNFVDSITSKRMTQGYLIKYRKYKNNLEDSKDYIKNKLFKELKNEYQNLLTKLRESLQQIKKNKISDIYPDFPELDFIDKNINLVNEFYIRLNYYFSDDKFNDFYLPQINEFKNNELNEITDIDSNIIEYYHNKIKTNEIEDDYQNDFCISYLRKKTYTCTNSVITDFYNSDFYCLPLSSESNNDEKLIQISTNWKQKNSEFLTQFNKLYSDLNKIIDSYTSQIINLKKDLLDSESNALKNNDVNQKLENINNEVEKILNDYYGEKLIIGAYNYFKQITNERITNVLEDLGNKWVVLFSDLKTEVTNNLDKYKNSIKEFGIMAKILQQMYIKNITNSFYDSIIWHQKEEYNYSIAYYYNYLHKSINSSYQLILSKIPQNKQGLDVILKERESAINSVFSNINQKIVQSKNLTLNINSQLYTLQIPETNFFETNDLLINSQLKFNSSLTQLSDEIYNLKNGKVNDEYSLTLRYYLENSDNGKQINDFYEEINNQLFIYLNLEKFKETILNNWIFDQDDFIKQLSLTLNNSNLEISKEFKKEKEDYTSRLNKLITQYFTKEEIIYRINDLYYNAYNHLESNEINQINENVNGIIEKVNNYLLSEKQRIETTLTSYNKDFSKINETINEYKNKIFVTVNKTIFNVLDEIYNNIYTNVYNNYVEHYLNIYYQKITNLISNYEVSNLLNSSIDLKETIHTITDNIVNEYKYITKSKIVNKYNDYYQIIYEEINLKSIENYINQQIEAQFNNLYEVLTKYAIYNIGNEGYTSYDLSDTIKKEIDDNLEIMNNNINEIIQKTKGENYEANIKSWKKPDFSRIDIEEIKNSFNSFIRKQEINEQNDLDECLQKIIKSNFNNLLNNLIPSFGNDFFDRIIVHNENFKINSLYDNLKWGLSQTLSYYISIFNSNSIKSITKDLKLKIFSLNNLDQVIDKNHKKLLEFLDIKIEEFIEDSRTQIKEKYISFVKNDVSINSAFNNIIKRKIDYNINLIIPDIESEYNRLLNKYMKERLIDSYIKVLNEKSNEMIITIKEQREFIKVQFDDLFSLDPDNILNDINTKLNNTQKAIKDYNEYLKTFQISQDILSYIENFGNNKIKPCYESFLNLMNEITKKAVLDNLEINSKTYENSYDKNQILKLLNNLSNELENKYIKIMNDSINSYGIDDYEDNLNKKIHKYKLRMLDTNENESLYSKKIADKSIDETFHKLLNSSKNMKNFIKNFEKFDEFDEIIVKNMDNLKSAYKSSKNLIQKNYEDETFLLMSEKLESLKNLTSDYYNQIKESFYQIKNYLNTSIQEIDNLLNLCANKTYSTFVEKYNEISEITQTKDKEQEEVESEHTESFESLSDNLQYYTDIHMIYLEKKANFKFTFNFDEINNFKMPKVYAHVINLSRPKKINMEIYSTFDSDGKNVQAYEIEFNNVNYSMILDFNTDSNDIISTVIADFDSYQYSEKRYIENYIKSDCPENSFIFCFQDDRGTPEIQIISPKTDVIVKEKNSTKIIIIPN